MDLVEALCDDKLLDREWDYRCRGVLDEKSLKGVFREDTSGGHLVGNHWSEHGQYFIDAAVTWEIIANKVSNVKFPDDFDLERSYSQSFWRYEGLSNARSSTVKQALRDTTHQLNGTAFRRLLADRDIGTELPSTALVLRRDGQGATNIIRRFIRSAELPREVIKEELLAELNSIFRSDGQFSDIEVQDHDEEQTETVKVHGEVYLSEETKGLIPLSKSGSGLKPRVERIREEVEKIDGAHIWITDAKEIENYLPGSVLSEVTRLPSLPDPEKHECWESYTEKNMGRKSIDKVALAISSTQYVTREVMKGRFEWKEQMEQIVERIKSWNGNS